MEQWIDQWMSVLSAIKWFCDSSIKKKKTLSDFSSPSWLSPYVLLGNPGLTSWLWPVAISLCTGSKHKLLCETGPPSIKDHHFLWLLGLWLTPNPRDCVLQEPEQSTGAHGDNLEANSAKFKFVFASNRWSHKDFDGFLFLLIYTSFTCCTINALKWLHHFIWAHI